MYYLKFYANCPNGEQNKLFTYPVHHGGHAFDLLRRFYAKGFVVRAAFVAEHVSAKGQQLAPLVLEHLAGGSVEQEAVSRAGVLALYPGAPAGQ